MNIPPDLPTARQKDLARVLENEAHHRTQRLGSLVPTSPPGLSGLPAPPPGHYYRRDGTLRQRGAPRRSTKTRNPTSP